MGKNGGVKENVIWVETWKNVFNSTDIHQGGKEKSLDFSPRKEWGWLCGKWMTNSTTGIFRDLFLQTLKFQKG